MLKRRIINWLTKHLLCAVNADEVVTILTNAQGKPLKVMIKGEQIADAQWKSLASEVKALESLQAFSIIMNTLAEQAKLRMFEQSKTDNDIIFGKAMLFTLDTQKKLLEALKQYPK